MLIVLKPYGDKPIYEQLMLEIKRGIINRELKPGEGLPGVRTLAGDIGVNMHTVNKVYKHLEKEKILVKEKNGFVVNPNKLVPTSDIVNDLEQKVYELVIEQKLYNLTDDEILRMMRKVRFEREDD